VTIVEVFTKELSQYNIVYIPSTPPNKGDWCKLPYPEHPHGCPNFGRKEGCPPKAKLFSELVNYPMFLIGIRFDLSAHIEQMRQKHPDWSLRQLKCLLYWQGHINKVLRQKCEEIASKHPDYIILYKPEANGINLFATCYKLGIILERSPQHFVWKIAIVGTRRDEIGS